MKCLPSLSMMRLFSHKSKNDVNGAISSSQTGRCSRGPGCCFEGVGVRLPKIRSITQTNPKVRLGTILDRQLRKNRIVIDKEGRLTVLPRNRPRRDDWLL